MLIGVILLPNLQSAGITIQQGKAIRRVTQNQGRQPSRATIQIAADLPFLGPAVQAIVLQRQPGQATAPSVLQRRPGQAAALTVLQRRPGQAEAVSDLQHRPGQAAAVSDLPHPPDQSVVEADLRRVDHHQEDPGRRQEDPDRHREDPDDSRTASKPYELSHVIASNRLKGILHPKNQKNES